MMSLPIRVRLPWLWGGLILAGCLLIYSHVVGFDFVAFDDDHNIVYNPHLGSLSITGISWAFADGEYMHRCLPLGWVGFSGIFSLFGLNPAGWHLVSLLLHASCSVLFFAVLRVFASANLSSASTRGWADVAAFFGTAFWAWHPLRAETVGWSSGVLYGQAHLFLFGAVSAWLLLPKMRTSSLFVLLLYTCSLLSYPIAMGFAPIFGLFALWRGEGWRKAGREALPFVSVAVLVLAFNVMARHSAVVPSLVELPIGSRVYRAAYMCLYYLWHIFWPFNLTPVNTSLLDSSPSFASLVLLISLSGAGLVWFRTRLFVFSYLCVLAPFLGWLEEGAFPSDRYSALPHAVLAIAVTIAIARCDMLRMRLFPGAFLAVISLALAFLSWRQVDVWRDTPQLQRCINERAGPGMPPIYRYVFMARWLFRDVNPTKAIALLDEALMRYPQDRALRTVRRDFAKIHEANAARSKALGLLHPPPLGAWLHWELALESDRKGESKAAAVHLAEMRRFSPEYYARMTGELPLRSR